ncbi:MAG: hypothetical protein LBP73_09325 [Clostridiales Family XIII bacterium]|nr:hypothetical protein [Clostridiales Family XIII bacterium]
MYRKLKRISTLRYICSPMATFTPMGERIAWEAGVSFRLNLKVMGMDFGEHVIAVTRFDTRMISTKEHNRHVPKWNHTILLEDLDERRTKYSDVVEISAGPKTPFIWLWANLFYRHRQRRWRALLVLHDEF